MSQNITVVGAGVQGLTTAVLLLHQGHNVTIVAKGNPEDWSKDPAYTSPKAGANWQSFASNDDKRQQDWDEQTFYTLWRLAHHGPAGVMHLPGFQFWDELPTDFVDPWYARITPAYSAVSEDYLPVGKKFGITFETVTMNVPKYMMWLFNQFRAKGGKYVDQKLAHLDQAYTVQKRTDVVVNCCGIGAMALGGVLDDKVYPTRGQTILVRAPQVRRTIGDVTYVIPREDGIVILGGTYQAHNGNLEPDMKTAQGIMDRCIAICPELAPNGKLPEIIEHSVGLRPTREGGVRFDAQYEKTSTGREILLIHNYGHGGFGYQSSWGCAANVVTIVRRAMGVSVDEKILSRYLESIFKGRANL
ncbi:D-amino-acid oxidase [Chytridium lagenaria]|nr:D-amino-acid oxidase [Chytridium lagenaria]